MKKTISTALLVALANCMLAQTQTEEKVFTEVNPPNFLVHRQLSPEILKLEYAGGIAKGFFKNTDDMEVNRFHQNTFTFSGYPVTLINKRHRQLYLGFGYISDQYTSFDNESSKGLLADKRETIYLNTFLNTRIKNKFYWFAYLQGGLTGTHPFEDAGNTFNMILLNKVNYKVKRNLNLGLGVAYISNLGDPLILPSVAFVYSQRHYLINLDFPVKAEVEGIVANGKWRPVAGVSFPAGTAYIKNANQYLSTLGTMGYVGMRYRVVDLLYVYAAYQVGLGDTFKAGTASDRKETGTYTDQSRFLISLNVQVARFIPLTREQ